MDISLEVAGSILGVIGALVLIAPDIRYKVVACTLWLISNICLILETFTHDQPFMAGMFVFYAATNTFTIAVSLAVIYRLHHTSRGDPSHRAP